MNPPTRLLPLWLCLAIIGHTASAQTATRPPKRPRPDAALNDYPLGPDSQKQPGVPVGQVFDFPFDQSQIFPGTTRKISVYVPAQYTAEKPACVYVGLDALGFSVPTVFDNLIHKGEMPVTIAIGVSPGTVMSVNEKEDPRFNRSFEFDGMNDQLARCVLDEILPAVEQKKTPDGRVIKLSKKGSDRCTGGGSTGGIAAFTLAWERPDAFQRVFTAIGTFVGMRGGDRYAVLVRKTEPKPLRIFMQDGENDEWMGGPEVGDWWMSNQRMQRALEFSGYEVEHVWGHGTHNGAHATAIFPDAMRYLWKGWPEPIHAQTAKTQNVILTATLDPESSWQLVEEAGQACDHLAVNPQGEIFYHDTAAKVTHQLKLNGQVTEAADIPPNKIFTFNANGQVITAEGIQASGITVTHEGSVYATDAKAGKAWLITSDGKKTLLDQGLKHPTGIAISPNGLWLAIMENHTHRGYSYRVKKDGTVELKMPFYWAHVPDWADDSGAGSMCMDNAGHPYVATHLGVQIFDRNGRSRGILPLPNKGSTSVCFGGANFETLFATSGGKLYRRHMKVAGAPSFKAPITLPPWGGG